MPMLRETFSCHFRLCLAETGRKVGASGKSASGRAILNKNLLISWNPTKSHAPVRMLWPLPDRTDFLSDCNKFSDCLTAPSPSGNCRVQKSSELQATAPDHHNHWRNAPLVEINVTYNWNYRNARKTVFINWTQWQIANAFVSAYIW